MPDAAIALPDRRRFDLRGPSGQWIDYFRATYPEWAHPSALRDVEPEPWPSGFEPAAAPIFAHNALEIAAPPKRVFDALLDARSWSSYYENARDVKLPDGATRLGPGMRFQFTTFGIPFAAEVSAFENERLLAWTCQGGRFVLRAHHRWLLRPSARGTRLVTEETNFLAYSRSFRPLNALLNSQLARSGTREALPAAHQRWLAQLQRTLEADA